MLKCPGLIHGASGIWWGWKIEFYLHTGRNGGEGMKEDDNCAEGGYIRGGSRELQ